MYGQFLYQNTEMAGIKRRYNRTKITYTKMTDSFEMAILGE